MQNFYLGVVGNVVLSPGMGDGVWKSVECYWTVSISEKGQGGATIGP